MPDDPRFLDFWDDEDALLWEALSPVVLDALMGGSVTAASLLPEGLDALIDWDGFNQAAIDFARQYRFEWIKGITETTREQTQQVMADWMASGDPLSVLEAQIEAIYGEARAASIAATEITRLFQEGNELAWQSTGLVEKMVWRTVQDDRVCPLCAPLDGTEIELGEGPPIHPGDRCYTEPVVSEELLQSALEGTLR
jgi:hypothetical protein